MHYAAIIEDHLDLLDEFLKVCSQSIKDVTIHNENDLRIALKYNTLEAFLQVGGFSTLDAKAPKELVSKYHNVGE